MCILRSQYKETTVHRQCGNKYLRLFTSIICVRHAHARDNIKYDLVCLNRNTMSYCFFYSTKFA